MILLRTNAELQRTFEKLIQTMKAPVNWSGIFAVVDNYIILQGEVRSLFFHFDTRKVATNILEIPVKEEGVIPIEDNLRVQNAINMLLYAFGKWGMIKGIRVDQDIRQLGVLFSNIMREYDVEPDYTPEHLHFYHGGIRVTYEDVIQMAIERERRDEEESGGAGLWRKIVWKSRDAAFPHLELSREEKKSGRLGHNFYLIAYACPDCGGKLYMVVYPQGREFRIETDEGDVLLARACTCSECQTFFTPRPGRLLSEGAAYEMAFGDDGDAYEDYLELLGRNGERVANHRCNEYADRRKNAALSGTEAEPLEMLISSIPELSDEEMKKIQARIEESFYSDESVLEFERARRLYEEGRLGFGEEGEDYGDEEEEDGGDEDLMPRDARDEGASGDGASHRGALGSDGASRLGESGGSLESHGRQRGAASGGGKDSPRWSARGGSPAARVPRPPRIRIDEGEEDGGGPAQGASAVSRDPAGGRGDSGDRGKAQGAKSIAQGAKNNAQSAKNVALDARSSSQSAKSVALGAKGNASGARGGASEIPDPRARYEAHFAVFDRYSERQIKDFKRQIEQDPDLDPDDKRSLLERVASRLAEGKVAQLSAKVDSCKGKSYLVMQRAGEEIERSDIPDAEKESLLARLGDMKDEQAAREVEQLIQKMPPTLDRERYKKYMERIGDYEGVDLSPYEDVLAERREAAERQEVANLVRHARKVDREDVRELVKKLSEGDFLPEIVAPYIEKANERLREMDEEAIEAILPDLGSMSFEEGMEALEQIEQGEFLPELKTNALETLKKRLSKIKTDECELLVAKLREDMAEAGVGENERHHFYPARRALLGQAPPEEVAVIDYALACYASDRGPFEYPILVVDASRNGSGKEGIILTPDHLYYSTHLNSYGIPIPSISGISASTGLLNKGVYARQKNGTKIKLPCAVDGKELPAFATALGDFVRYLQEKPDSRSLSYLASEKHDKIICFRCGYSFKDGNVCPRCGYQNNG